MGIRGLKIMLIASVAILAGAEGYLRFVTHARPGPLAENTLPETLAKFVEFDPVTGLHYKPNVDTLIDAPSQDFSILYKINEMGLRDRAMGTHLRQELKFLVFGDEFAEGWGTDIDETAVVRAQNLINKKTDLKPPVRLVIGARSGFGAAQNYLVAKSLFEAIPPKLVIFFYSSLMPHADAQFLANATLANGLATGLKDTTEHPPRLPHLEDSPPTPHGLLANLAPYSSLAKFLAEQLAQHAHAADIRPGDPASDRLAGIRAGTSAMPAVHGPSLQYVKAIADLAKLKGAPFLLVHVPLPPQVAAGEWRGGRTLFDLPATVLPVDDIAVVQKFCADNSLKCVSLLELLQKTATAPNSSRLFHSTELGFAPGGTRVVGAWLGNTLYDWMGELGWRK